MTSSRPVFFNPHTQGNNDKSPQEDTIQVQKFHKSLPNYHPTKLTALPDLARELGLKEIYVKEESSRFNLPSFKILGASYGTFRALTQRFTLADNASIETVKEAVAKSGGIKLFAATEGNHGRAVARMGSLVGANVEIIASKFMLEHTKEAIRSECAILTQIEGTYDESMRVALRKSNESDGILIQDTAFDEYEKIPQWIVDGYSTMMVEIDEKLGHLEADLVITPVGVGSLAQAVVSHYKTVGKEMKVLTVEPDTAAYFYHSFKNSRLGIIDTTATIMNGMNCGTCSTLAWPVLQRGVDASLTVLDCEAEEGLQLLGQQGISAGPCGGASVAALRRSSADDKAKLDLTFDSVVVLLCTEGRRDYIMPTEPDS